MKGDAEMTLTTPATCPTCGLALDGGAQACPRCGTDLMQAPARLRLTRGPAVDAALEGPAARGLGDAFHGAPAGMGVRIAALLIDAVAVFAVAVLAGVVFQSWLLALIFGVEAVVFLAALQARHGLSLGYALLRLRLSRQEDPLSPGIGRVAARGVILGAGAAVAGIGAVAVEGTAALDPQGRKRSWADRAAGTVVVAVPARRRGVPERPVAPHMVLAPLSNAPAFDLSASQEFPAGPGEVPLQPAPGLQAPQMIPGIQPAHGTGTESRTGSGTGDRDGAQPLGAVPGTPREHPALEEGQLMIIFDTGQRVLLPISGAANLGRNPDRIEEGDRLVIVSDPEQSVSKTHLRLEHSRAGTWVTDRGSTNGTRILDDEGETTLVEPWTRTQLPEGARIRMGDRVFTISEISGGAA